jgi:gamma-glutamylcyclotransferase (GGCT)/AIG2-like uncharacterized protein YtfP
MNKLFVYGIFLDEYMRENYGMTNPKYATVLDYATFGGNIVMAVKIPKNNLSLTGLLVDMNPDKWEDLDRLEGGYRRVRINTTNNQEAYMYVK